MIQTSEYKGWQALTLDTGDLELVIPTDIGPRIISAAFKGEANLFAENAEQIGGTGEDEFMVRGGHRLWHAPEHPERTYECDNFPIQVEQEDNVLTLVGRIDPLSGIEKKVRIDVLNKTSFKVTHIISNQNAWPVETAPWALSVMKHGGYAVIPLPPKRPHSSETLLPETVLVPWAYTDLSLPLWNFQKDFIGVDTSHGSESQKLGIGTYPGWTAFWQEAGTMVKFAQMHPYADYPDNGCAFEIFCCDWMCEMETLAPLTLLQPQDSVQHVEYWGFLEDLPKPVSQDIYQDKFRPVVQHWLEHTLA